MSRIHLQLAIGILGPVCLGGCALFDSDLDYHKAADDLDYVERSIDRWGTTTISDILFVPNKGQFKIEYSTNVDFYVSQARQEIQGGEVITSEQIQDYLASLNVQVTPPVTPDAPAAPGKGTNASSASVPALPASVADKSLSSNSFSALQQLAKQAPTISERQAVLIGFNDKVAELLLKIMANPEVVPTNYVVLLGTMQVSCQPGWQTRRGYMADVNITMEYETDVIDRGKGLTNYVYSTTDPPYDQPTILAVLPLIDSQRLDLRNSQRKQFELVAQLALSFAAKGINAQTQQLFDYLKRQQADAVTRTAVPLATSYTDSTSFGFQLYPSLSAVEDTDKTYSKSGDTLQAVSFPAVVAVAMRKGEIEHEHWTNYVFDTQSRWIPTRHGMPIQTNRERIEMARRLDFVESLLKGEAPTGPMRVRPLAGMFRGTNLSGSVRFPLRGITVANNESFARLELRRNFRNLSELGSGMTQEFPLQPLLDMANEELQRPAITNVVPTVGWINAPTVFTIQGSNFVEYGASAVKSVTVGGRACEIQSVDKHSLVAVLPASSTSEMTTTGPVEIAVSTKAGVVSSNAIMFAQKTTSPEYPSIMIGRTERGDITNIAVTKAGMPLKDLLDEVKDIWAKSVTNSPAKDAAGDGGATKTTNATITLKLPAVISK